MIARTPGFVQAPCWQQQLADAVEDTATLCALLGLDADDLGDPGTALVQFPLRVPHSYIARMQHGNPRDPLLQQVLPQAAELNATPGFVADPLGEEQATAVPGIIHKYAGRVLLVATGACAVHCRYCFRRHFPYDQHRLSSREWTQALDYVRADDTITEVILSGGDPLAINDQRLATLVGELDSIAHLKRLRLHTRLPVVLPDRVDAALCGWLAASRLGTIVVIHVNHPREIDTGLRTACRRLLDAGATVLNQTVLLAGVNDNADTLANLSESLFSTGVLPYYLHVLDRVAGSAHFDVGEARARSLYHELLMRLPGYLTPRLVRELPALPYKQPLSPALPIL